MFLSFLNLNMKLSFAEYGQGMSSNPNFSFILIGDGVVPWKVPKTEEGSVYLQEYVIVGISLESLGCAPHFLLSD